MPPHLALGLVLAAGVSAGALRARALTPGAALAATCVGALVFAGGGFPWSFQLLSFFVSASLLSALPADGRPVSDTGRTARQVLANGIVPAAYAGLSLLVPSDMWRLPFACAVATAAADTWATEIGRRSGARPRDVLTGRRVPIGTSGGITIAGCLASVAGSSLVALTSLPAGIGSEHLPVIAWAGCGGALIDSLLGASLQERRWCPHCLVETEQKLHEPCGTATEPRSGLSGFDNDWVNASACLAGSVLGVVLAHSP